MNLKSAPATILLGVLGLLVLAGLGWVGLIGPALSDRSATDDARAQAQDANQAMRLELARLRQQADDLPTTDALAADLDTMFPATADQPGFFEQVSDIATQAGVGPRDVTVLSPGVPVILESDPAAAAATGTTAPEAGTAPSVSASDLAIQEVTIGVNGSYDQLVEVLDGIEKMPRAFLVGSIDLAADDTRGMTLTVVGSTFVAPPLKPETT